MRKIRILHIIGNMNRGGAETFLMNLLRNINTEKFQFVFVCYGNDHFDYEIELLNLGGEIVKTPDVKQIGSIKHIHNIIKIIKDNNIDIIHAHTYNNSVFSIVAAIIVGVKSRVVHAHCIKSDENPTVIKRLYYFISKVLINMLSNKRVACSQDAGKSLYYRDFTIIDNGIEIESFTFDKSYRSELRKLLQIDDSTVVIGHVGRLEASKNHTFILKVFKEYNAKNPKSKLLLVGDGSERAKIKNATLEMAINDEVILMGKRSDINLVYSAFDIFLFPSLHEGLGMVLIEAQANGLTCLASDNIDKATQVTNNIHYCSLSSSAIAWANKITELSHKRSDAIGMANGKYDISTNVESIEKLYLTTLKNVKHES